MKHILLDAQLDCGLATRGAIGLLVLANDLTIEHEYRGLFARDGVALYEARLPSSNMVTTETLHAIGEHVTPATDTLVPGSRLDVVAFGCSSATIVLGEDAIFSRIQAARPDVACTTPITAAMAAFAQLRVTRVGLITPYVPEVNQKIVDHLERQGLTITSAATFSRGDDREAARISQHSIAAAARAIVRDDRPDAIFVCCTSLRLLDTVVMLEEELGLPVTSSNHAMAWHALRLAGVDDVIPGVGRLFEQPLTARRPSRVSRDFHRKGQTG